MVDRNAGTEAEGAFKTPQTKSRTPHEAWLTTWPMRAQRLTIRAPRLSPKPPEVPFSGGTYRLRAGRDLDQRISAAAQHPSKILRSIYPVSFRPGVGPIIAREVGSGD